MCEKPEKHKKLLNDFCIILISFFVMGKWSGKEEHFVLYVWRVNDVKKNHEKKLNDGVGGESFLGRGAGENAKGWQKEDYVED